MFEDFVKTAYKTHPYRWTTIGNMDQLKNASSEELQEFFNKYYIPNNACLVIAGDIDTAKTKEWVRKYYGWIPKGPDIKRDIPEEPPQTEAKQGRVDWPNPTSPYMLVGYRSPAFAEKGSAEADLIEQLLFSETAPLYKEVVVDQQWADTFAGFNDKSRDPSLFSYYARAKSEDAIVKIKEAVDRHVRELQEKPVDAQRLERIKSNLRYAFAQSLGTPTDIADQASRFIGVAGDIGSINRRFAEYQKITPEDVQRAAREIFRPQNETMVTLSHKAETPAQQPGAQGGAAHD
jgi:zinc protease